MFFQQRRKILVIGATGGIGSAMSRLLLEQGHELFITSRDTANEQFASLEKYAEQQAQSLSLLEMDLSSQGSIAAAFNRLAGQTDRLHLVMNCTGLLHDASMQPEKKLEDLEMENLQRSFQVNSSAPLLIARYALPLLQHDEPSVLANMSARVGSISDNRIGGWYAYRAAKAAQNMATRSLAIELQRRSKNTIVVGLHPGTVDTGLSQPFQSSVKPGQLQTPEQATQHLYTVINRLGSADSGKVFAWDGVEILP